MEQFDWLRELALSEKKLEEDGFLNNPDQFDLDRIMAQASVDYMIECKNHFVSMVDNFNELKTSPYGKIKIFHVTNTHLDFMLFRNNLKFIFSLREPGLISARFETAIGPYVAFQNPGQLSIQVYQAELQQKRQTSFVDFHSAPIQPNGPTQAIGEHTLLAKWAPFNQLKWHFRDQEFQRDAMVKYYLSLFIRESSK